MRISVIGGGYVGLVSSACLAELGHKVNLVEIDHEKADAINSGKPRIHEKGLEELLSTHVGRRLRASAGYENVRRSEISFICVGTPSGRDGRSDLSMVQSASKSIGKSLRDIQGYHVVVVKSTVPPGTTEGLVIPEVLEASGRGPDDLGFAMNPEFLREGLAIQDFMNPDRIVIGSADSRARDYVERAYEGLKAPVVRTGLVAAEMIKYASNAFLATKISFSNEVGNLCKRLGIDVYEVMGGVGLDHRIGPHFLNAGAGFGGSCFPKDVAALISLAEDMREDPAILKAVMEVNGRQPLRMVELLQRRIGDLQGRRIAVLGLAFKDGTDDIRESRAIAVIARLMEMGASVAAYDPVAESSMRKLFPDIEYYETAAGALQGAEACLIMTEWPEFGLLEREFDLMKNRVIIEGRRVLPREEVEGLCREGICW